MERSGDTTYDAREVLELAERGGDFGIWDCFPQTETTFYSPGYKQILGYRENEFPNTMTAWRDALHPEDRERALETSRAALESGSDRYECEFRMRCKNGNYCWILSRAFIKRDAAGRALRMTGIHVDITAEKRAALSMATAHAELEQFSHVVTHDLSEPLRMIQSYSQLLVRRYEKTLDEEGREFLSILAGGARRLSDLLYGLGRLSRMELRQARVREIETGDVVSGTLHALEVGLEERGAQVTCGALPRVQADPGQLGQLFQNLIGNAIKYVENQPPRVHVAAEDRGSEWVFSIADNGPGIPEPYRERVFRPFYRIPGAPSSGSGIGLAVCRRIVDRHHGRIWVDGGVDGGSVFRFTLPKGVAAH